MIPQDREVSEKDGPHRIKRFILFDLRGNWPEVGAQSHCRRSLLSTTCSKELNHIDAHLISIHDMCDDT
jgi:hypothetical protein